MYSIGVICSNKTEFNLFKAELADEVLQEQCYLISKIEHVRGKRFDELITTGTADKIPNIEMLLTFAESRLKNGNKH